MSLDDQRIVREGLFHVQGQVDHLDDRNSSKAVVGASGQGLAIARRRWRGVDLELPVVVRDIGDVVEVLITTPEQTSGT